MSFRDTLGRLYSGDTKVNFIGKRRAWYLVSLVLMLVCVGGMGLRNFNLGIEFVGGTQFQATVVQGISADQVQKTVESTGVQVASSQTAGSGSDEKYIVHTDGDLSNKQQENIKKAMSEKLKGEEISVSNVSSSWGSSVSQQAIIALVVSLVLITAYLWWRYERKMAGAALIALAHDLVLTAGIYALVGFEVTPSTVVGILTILGYSLYDTVVVFDKVHENTRDVFSQQRFTYADGANLAINQTLMRSINTSLIGLLPVAGLLFVGAGLLGVGTLKDLALVLFVGMLTGAYSSLFLATPLTVDFKLREPRLKEHTRKVESKRAASGESDVDVAAAVEKSVAETEDDAETDDADEPAEETPPVRPKAMSGAGGPRPGARPATKRTTAKKKKKR
ncbi:MAG TPA: protein translocase subunit SecF [Stackebrandtia sp.]|uniref:protein translocase subunit SecF n=1 Tax=Stackebrandtia sp. TaxID=2023065 RepID=UPI002D691A97|nr:protein translocase subunit SecF [Stackebrandtia sp.]HZE41755.1 protein translocase subunit SecF [Stackebrandtia sp.]